MAKVSKRIQNLFLKLLNFPPDLLYRTQQAARIQNTSFDVLIREAVDKYLRGLTAAREQQEADLGEARMRLRAHFAEDRNEFLTEDDIRIIGG